MAGKWGWKPPKSEEAQKAWLCRFRFVLDAEEALDLITANIRVYGEPGESIISLRSIYGAYASGLLPDEAPHEHPNSARVTTVESACPLDAGYYLVGNRKAAAFLGEDLMEFRRLKEEGLRPFDVLPFLPKKHLFKVLDINGDPSSYYWLREQLGQR